MEFGKTTSIGKIANRLQKQGKKVMLAAADTFRAAAVEQLEIWANRVNCKIVKKDEGSDPASVVFDAIKKAKEENIDTYSSFIKEVDTVIMGRNTYKQIITELSPNQWIYHDLTTYVITHR